MASRLSRASSRSRQPDSTREASTGALSDRALIVLQTMALLAMAGTVATRLWQEQIWFGWVLTGVTVAVWLPSLIHWQTRSWWFIYVAGIFVYTLLRSYADQTGMPIQATYPIEIDRVLFLGNLPIPWLQEQLFDPEQIRPLDWAAVAVHWTFFLVPHAAAVLVFLFRRELFPKYAALIVGTMYASLVLFFLLPTAPPWMASQQGQLGEVQRIMDYVGGRVSGPTYEEFYASLGEPNSVAAMPSLHMGITFAVLLWAWEYHRRLAAVLAAYNLLMFGALMYLGEHYAIDMIAGAAIAGGVYWLVRRAFRKREQAEPEGGNLGRQGAGT